MSNVQSKTITVTYEDIDKLLAIGRRVFPPGTKMQKRNPDIIRYLIQYFEDSQTAGRRGGV